MSLLAYTDLELTPAQYDFADEHEVDDAISAIGARDAVFMYTIGGRFTDRWLVLRDGQAIEHERLRRSAW